MFQLNLFILEFVEKKLQIENESLLPLQSSFISYILFIHNHLVVFVFSQETAIAMITVEFPLSASKLFKSASCLGIFTTRLSIEANFGNSLSYSS